VACLDYSFVTGESEPVEKHLDDYLYAGGRQIGGAVEIEIVKPVSQSYLTSLWNQEAFRKDKDPSRDTLINVFSYRFTMIVIAIAIGSALFWAFIDPSKSLKAFTSVLIVACPCALALAAPFTLGTAIRVLGRRKVFVKSPEVIEALARVESIVFDKTGTLTAAGAQSIGFEGPALSQDELRWIHSLTRHSTHPLSLRIAESIEADFTEPVRSFEEKPGCGIEGVVGGQALMLGSAAWLRTRGIGIPERAGSGSVVEVATNGEHRGCFVLETSLRSQVGKLLRELSRGYELTLLSGDHEKQRETFAPLFGDNLHFHQSPLDKLDCIHGLQRSGKAVMMVGDGLNDAGALKQSNVGVAVVEDVAAFSPASDIIMSASMVSQLDAVLQFSKSAVRIVRLSFLLSSVYNVLGIGIAASGLLAPIVCAILMPVSSITIVAFACGATTWAARRDFATGQSLLPLRQPRVSGSPRADASSKR
jgi:P-type Cu+ transporter